MSFDLGLVVTGFASPAFYLIPVEKTVFHTVRAIHNVNSFLVFFVRIVAHLCLSLGGTIPDDS